MPRSTRSSKPSAKRRLDFDDNDTSGSNTKVAKIEQEDAAGDDEVEEVLPSTTPTTLTGTPQKRKRDVSSYFSPVASRKNKAAVVTPEKPEARTTAKRVKKEQNKEHEAEQYVPTYIHKNLNYQRRGQASISEELKKTFALVEQHYEIPNDFETNKKRYGPLSGTCFEERVVTAYDHGLLESKSDTITEICSHCAVTGHKREDCPVLI